MRVAEWINIAFFSCFTVLALRRPMRPGRRLQAVLLGVTALSLVMGLAFVEGSLPPPVATIVHDWLPAPLMMMAYWQAGRFFTSPWLRFQSRLVDLDSAWLGSFIRGDLQGQARFWLEAYLELAYMLCYPLVPCALGVLYLARMKQYADYYWMVVLPPSYLCYGMTAFIHTLPPRLVEPEPAGCASVKGRAFNLWILNHASNEHNTFPSAHVAATTSASLVLLHLVPAWGVVFLWISASIALGAVVRRYHYALDALIGAALAFAAFLLLG